MYHDGGVRGPADRADRPAPPPDLGDVGEVVADRQKDIFSGITVTSGLLSGSRFAPADIIDDMSATAITLSITSAQAEELAAT